MREASIETVFHGIQGNMYFANGNTRGRTRVEHMNQPSIVREIRFRRDLREQNENPILATFARAHIIWDVKGGFEATQQTMFPH